MLIIVGALVIGSLQVSEVIKKNLPKFVKTGNSTPLLNDLRSELSENVWFDISIYGYIISFIDLWFLIANKERTAEHKDKDESAQN